MVLLLNLLLARTRVWRALRAIAENPSAATLMGVELVSSSKAYGVKVKLDREALLNFEEIKRAGNPNAKGAARLKNNQFSLPLTGPALNH